MARVTNMSIKAAYPMGLDAGFALAFACVFMTGSMGAASVSMMDRTDAAGRSGKIFVLSALNPEWVLGNGRGFVYARPVVFTENQRHTD